MLTTPCTRCETGLLTVHESRVHTSSQVEGAAASLCSIEQIPQSLQANPSQGLPKKTAKQDTDTLKMTTVSQAFGFAISTCAFLMS